MKTRKKRGKKVDVAIGDDDKNNNDHGAHTVQEPKRERESAKKKKKRKKKNDQLGQERNKQQHKELQKPATKTLQTNTHACASIAYSMHITIAYIVT